MGLGRYDFSVVYEVFRALSKPRRDAGARRVVPRYRTRVEDVPLVQGLREDEGWVDMQVQFLIDAASAGSERLVFGRTVLPPGAEARPPPPLPECDEFLLVMSGNGLGARTNEGMEPAAAGGVIFTPAGDWHGFDNTSGEDVELIWGWAGAGSLEAAGWGSGPSRTSPRRPRPESDPGQEEWTASGNPLYGRWGPGQLASGRNVGLRQVA